MSFAAEQSLRVLEVHAFSGVTPSELLEICDAALTGEPINTGRNTIWAVDWHGKSLAIKAFGIPWGVRQWIYGSLRASKAKRSFENASTLIALGLHTPKPLGYLEFGSRARLLKSFYVSEYLPSLSGVFPLRDVLLDANRLDRVDILVAFGRYTCKLHDLGVLHRDYSPGNILVMPMGGEARTAQDNESLLLPTLEMRSSSSPAYRFELVDLNRMSFGNLSLKQRMHNLRFLWANDDDMKSVVMGYAEAYGQQTNRLLQTALRASQMHKARATREEWLKNMLRAWLGNGSPARGSS
jgi:hypothetical protein